jgi:hypothetical protein
MAALLFPRDGVDQRLPDPHGHTLIVVGALMATLSTILVTARVITRLTITRPTGFDDYAIILATVRPSFFDPFQS